MAITYINIASQTLGSNQASVTFSSIPSTYTDLVLQISARSSISSTVDQINISVNGSSSTAYSRTGLRGDGASAVSTRQSNATSWQLGQAMPGSTSTSNTFSSIEIYIPNYSSGSSTKPTYAFTTAENNNATAYIWSQALRSNVSSTISSLTLTSPSNNFVTGSTFYLYGIKNS